MLAGFPFEIAVSERRFIMIHNSCPACKKPISWIQKWKFTKGFCSRKTSPCPHCGIMLIWSKWPHRLIITGCCLIFVLSSFVLFKIDIGVASWILTFIAVLLILISVLTLKFEMAQPEKNELLV